MSRSERLSGPEERRRRHEEKELLKLTFNDSERAVPGGGSFVVNSSVLIVDCRIARTDKAPLLANVLACL